DIPANCTKAATEQRRVGPVYRARGLALHDVGHPLGKRRGDGPAARRLSLQALLDRDGPLGLHEVLRIGMQTASGLAAAHAQGLVHRRCKPFTSSKTELSPAVEAFRVDRFPRVDFDTDMVTGLTMTQLPMWT